jgi:hypothetical protein
VLVTDVGEIVKETNATQYEVFRYDQTSGQYFIFDLEQASPYWILRPDVSSQPVYRFVDTTSRIDLVAYKSTFLGNPSSEPIEYTLQVYESDDVIESATPFWIPNQVSEQTNYLFIQRCKRFVKFEVEFFSDLDESYFVGATPTINYILLVEVQIADANPSNTTFTTRDIVKKFPSWTKIYEDSLEGATPRFDEPKSLGGKLINASVGDHLDKVESAIDYFDLNKSISGANTDSLAWIYSTTSVPSAVHSVFADDIELSGIVNYSDFINHRVGDYVYYFNPVDKVVLTLEKYTKFYINNISYEQNEVLVFNMFDDFGLRVGIPRLKLESNENYKKRILDVYKNPPGTGINAFKRTLRRELDLWKAIGSTPDSDFAGATPEVLEMQDIEKLSKFFYENGNPTNNFTDFVSRMNRDYPTNWGFVSWSDLIWDYAGKLSEGVSHVPFVYDRPLMEATPSSYYQHGVGDLSDIKLQITENEDFSSDENILNNISDDQVLRKSAKVVLSGVEKIGSKEIYPPINVDFDYYTEYEYLSSNSPTATVNYTIELTTGGIVYYANATKYVRNDAPIRGSSATPDYLIHNIFSQIDNRTEPTLRFRSKVNNSEYRDFSATPSTYRIPSNIVSSGSVKYGHFRYSSSTPRYERINHSTPNQSYLALASLGQIYSANYPTGIYFDSTPSLSQSSPSFNNFNLRYASDMYSYSVSTGYTPKIRRRITLAPYANSMQSATPIQAIPFSSFTQNIYQRWGGATPKYLHIDNVSPSAYIDPDYATPSDNGAIGYGGFSYHPEFDQDILVPHILIRKDESTSSIQLFATPKYDISSGAATPQNINIYWEKNQLLDSNKYYTNNGQIQYNYPFVVGQWKYFEKELATPITFDISSRGIIKNEEDAKTGVMLSDVVVIKDFHRYEFGFNQNNSSNYIINYIEVMPYQESSNNVIMWLDKNNIKPYFTVSQDDDLRIPNTEVEPSDFYEEKFSGDLTDGYIEDVTIRARLNTRTNPNLGSEIHTGWYYLDEEETYVYARPKQESFVNSGSTPNYSFRLANAARQSAPIIIDISEYPENLLTRTNFVEENDRSLNSFYNIEYIEAKNSNNLYLGYKNVYDVSVFDSVTNSFVVENKFSETEKITVSDHATPIILEEGREYKVKYRVRNSYYVDNEDYNNGVIGTKIYFDSTPMYGATPLQGPFTYNVTYESSIFDTATPTGLYHSPIVSLNSEHFVYLTNSNYEYDRFIAQMNPAVISDNRNADYSLLTIESLDKNLNPKPYQTYSISSSNLSATPSTVTTNDEGFAVVELRYKGAYPATVSYDTILISGVASGQSVATDSATINYQIVRSAQTTNRLIAENSQQTIRADGQSSLYVTGKIISQDSTVNNIRVYYRKARTLKDAFDLPYSSSVLSSQNGSFSIGPITSQNAATPGYWFMVIDSVMEDGSVTNISPETIVGDIVHWYEDADDVITSSSIRVYPIQESFISNQINYFYATPVYKVSYITGDESIPSAKNTLNIPSWVKIPRYAQYQAGILGDGYYEYKNQNNVYPS